MIQNIHPLPMVCLIAKAKKQLLHEWMHSRYGVFDEHPVATFITYSGKDSTTIDQQKFYHSSFSMYEAVRYGVVE